MEMLDPATLERMTIEAFERVKVAHDYERPTHGSFSFMLEIVPEQARVDERGTWLTLRLVVFEDESIRDVKEQEVVVIPADADDARIPAYLDGLAVGIRRCFDTRGAEVETLLPHDFIPFRAFRDPARTTVEEFAACVGAKEPDPQDVVLDDLTGTEPIAVNRDLERAIESDPDRIENHLVYADWLTEQGDPRGELIACLSPMATPTARRRAASIMAQNARYFSGALEASDELSQYLALTWNLGWIATAYLGLDYEIWERRRDLVEQALRGLMGHPSSKFLRGLTLGCIDFEGNNKYDRLYPLLRARPTMRELFIGDTTQDQTEISWTHAGDLDVVNRLFPNLTKLKIRAGSMQMKDVAYPKLESLVIQTGGLAATNVRAIASATWPELRELELWFGSSQYGGNATIADIALILSGAGLPKLERLALRNCEFTDEICTMIAVAPITARLRELDLSMGVMSDEGAGALLADRAHLAHLRLLDVGNNFVSPDVMAELATLGIELGTQEQRRLGQWDEGRRYVAIGE